MPEERRRGSPKTPPGSAVDARSGRRSSDTVLLVKSLTTREKNNRTTNASTNAAARMTTCRSLGSALRVDTIWSQFIATPSAAAGEGPRSSYRSIARSSHLLFCYTRRRYPRCTKRELSGGGLNGFQGLPQHSRDARRNGPTLRRPRRLPDDPRRRREWSRSPGASFTTRSAAPPRA